jgi:hypothetical protein
MKPLELKESKPYRLCFYDFETQQNKKIYDKKGKTKYVHEPNFVGLHVVCSECIENDIWDKSLDRPCRICGPHRKISFAPFIFHNTKVDHAETTKDPLNSFVDHILYNFNPKYKTIAMAHNGGRFDTIMIFKNLYNRKLDKNYPQMIRRGNKLIELTIKRDDRLNITETSFRDSYNLTHFALSKFVKAFGLSIQEKRHFPHYYNEEKNYYINLPHLPDLEYYRPNSKKPEEKEELLKWHKQHYNDTFQLSKKLAEYCMSDVTHRMIALTK